MTVGSKKEPKYSGHYLHLDIYTFGFLAFLLEDKNPGKVLSDEGQAILRRLKNDANQHRIQAEIGGASTEYDINSKVEFRQLRKYLLKTDYESQFQKAMLERGEAEDEEAKKEKERNEWLTKTAQKIFKKDEK